MIFKPELVHLIQAGRKTQTRRRVKPAEASCRYRAGKDYAVQPGRGRSQACRIVVTEVERNSLLALTQVDAMAEGFRTRAEFADYWMRLYDAGWRADREEVACGADETLVLDRFNDRCDIDVWVISFALDRSETPIFMAERSGTPSGDYVTSPHKAMRGEQEAVPVAVLDVYARRNNAIHAARRAGMDDETLSQYRTLSERLHVLDRLARERGIDVRAHVRIIERRMDAIEKQIREQRPAA